MQPSQDRQASQTVFDELQAHMSLVGRGCPKWIPHHI